MVPDLGLMCERVIRFEVQWGMAVRVAAIVDARPGGLGCATPVPAARRRPRRANFGATPFAASPDRCLIGRALHNTLPLTHSVAAVSNVELPRLHAEGYWSFRESGDV